MNMIKRLFYTCFTLFFYNLLDLTFQQQAPANSTPPDYFKELSLDVEKKFDITPAKPDSIDETNYNYFKLVIPPTKFGKQNLVVKVKSTIKFKAFVFPRIYIDKDWNNVKNKNSKWKSNVLKGDEIIIPSAEVNKDDVFYIGIFCDDKCSYDIISFLSTDIYIELNKQKITTIQKDKSVTYMYSHSKDNKATKLDFFAYSTSMSEFKMYVTRDSPDLRDIIKQPIIPSFIGYALSLSKDDSSLCESCIYFITLVNELDVDVTIVTEISSYLTPKEIDSKEGDIKLINRNNVRCYHYEIEKGKEAENLLVSLTLFSGAVTLYVSPGEDYYAKKGYINDLKPNYYIDYTKTIKISPNNRMFNNQQTNSMFLCIYGARTSTYFIKVMMESEVEMFQETNEIFNGIDTNGYLPANKTTKYYVADTETQKDLTINMETISGKPKLYAFYCEDVYQDSCFFDETILKKQINEGKILFANETLHHSNLFIPDSQNTCHKKNKAQKVDNPLYLDACTLTAVIHCEGNVECQYTINFVGQNSHKLLKEKTTELGYVDYKNVVYYKFKVEDPLINEVDLVVNVISGDIDVLVDQDTKFPIFPNKTESLDVNNVPDFFEIKRAVGDTKPIGTVYIAVFGKAMSMFNIVYRVKREGYVEENVTKLKKGEMLKDHVPLEKTPYKFYVYQAGVGDSEDTPAKDIRISLTSEKSDFKIYALMIQNNFSYDPETNTAKGFNWESNYNNEIVINSADSNYQRFGRYYIVVVHTERKHNKANTKSDFKHQGTYYLTVTDNYAPIFLQEGVPHTATLNNQVYKEQTYFYRHYNSTKTAKIDFNSNSRVNVFVSFDKEFKEIKQAIYNKANGVIEITEAIMKDNENCRKFSNCDLHIKVEQADPEKADTRSINTKYTLLVKTTKPTFIEMGTTDKVDIAYPGINNHYYTYVNKHNHTFVSAKIENGFGTIYISIVNHDALSALKAYPTSKNFDVKSTYSYLGQSANVPATLLTQKCISMCKLLITFVPDTAWSENKSIHLKLSVYNHDKQISRNQPYRGFITKGEMQYFSLYLQSPLKTISVSVTNQDGDVDMVMNYGRDNFPLLYNSTWESISMNSELITINWDDKFFKDNHLSIDGWYTIGLIGTSNSTYTLHVATHPHTVVQLTDFSPSNCMRNNATSNSSMYCFYRYDQFSGYDREEDTFDIILSTEYYYGSGLIYAKLVTVEEFKDNDYFEALPKEETKDKLSSTETHRNQLYVKIPKNDPKLAKDRKVDPVLLIAVHCLEECHVALTAAPKTYNSARYLDKNRDNLVYMGKNSNSSLLFYDNHPNNIDLKVRLIKGAVTFAKANRESYFMLNNHGQLFHDKIVKSKQDTSPLYFLYAHSNQDDTAFYINMSYDDIWNKMLVNAKHHRYIVNNQTNQFFGYFHMDAKYESVLLSAKATGVHNDTDVKLYVKYLVLDKKNNIDEYLKSNYTVPNYANSEIIEEFNKPLYTISYKIPGLDKKVDNKHNVIALVRVEFSNLYFELTNQVSKTTLQITLVPKAYNSTAKIDLEPSIPIFTRLYGNNTSQVFDLKRTDEKQDAILLEISPCESDLSFYVSDKIEHFNKEEIGRDTDIEFVYGRYVTTIKPISNTQYLTIKKGFKNNYFDSTQEKKYGTNECKYTDKENCPIVNKGSEVWLRYMPIDSKKGYTKNIINKNSFIKWDITNRQIKLSWNPIVQFNSVSNSKDNLPKVSDVFYYIFASKQAEEFDRMQSLCSISKDFVQQGKTFRVTTETEFTYDVSSFEDNTDEEIIVYFNVLAVIRDQTDGEVYIPIKVLVPRVNKVTSIAMIVVSIIISLSTIVLLFFAFKICRKYYRYKSEIEYERADLRNLVVSDKSDTELGDMRKQQSKEKYSNLTEDVSKV